jgi:hypothetical protein
LLDLAIELDRLDKVAFVRQKLDQWGPLEGQLQAVAAV